MLRAAVTFADEHGIGSLTMRKLGEALGVEAMSLYKHVASKGDLLDGMIDLVFSEIGLPPPGAVWKTAIAAGRSPPSGIVAPPLGDNLMECARRARPRDAAAPRRCHQVPSPAQASRSRWRHTHSAVLDGWVSGLSRAAGRERTSHLHTGE